MSQVAASRSPIQDGTIESAADESALSRLNFKYDLRRYQKEIIEIVNRKIRSGKKEVHIVAPPGAGKTIIGLQIVSHLKAPSLILSPNTTIQAQWSQKISHFLPETGEPLDPASVIGTHEDRPLKPITVLTYQVLSTPGREQEYLEQLGRKEWVNELRKNRGISHGDAELRLLEILQNNPTAYRRELSRHISRLRKRLSDVLDINEVLHKNAINLIQTLRRQGVKTVIFDECHHLTDYWAAIMHHLVAMLDDPVVVALTGTPPEGKSASQEHRYSSLVGEIDYRVPTPALVREGGLAPYQDLVYFTRPLPGELEFLASQHQGFHELVDELIGKRDELTEYRVESVDNLQSKPESKPGLFLPDGSLDNSPDKILARYQIKDQNGKFSPLLSHIFNRLLGVARDETWLDFAAKRPQLASAMCRTMWSFRLPVPRNVSRSETVVMPPTIDDWMAVIEDYASTVLKLSASRKDHALYNRIRSVSRKLGYGITERGLRRQASPSDRVLAFSESKGQAVCEILSVEFRSLQESLRAIVVTDFESMSATGLKSVQGVLSDDAGGAIAVLRAILDSPVSASINPCLVTGSLLITDKRITARFVSAATRILRKKGFRINLEVYETEGEPFSRITANSTSWEPRLYVRLATELFEAGISKCLIGTRGLFGEGWDSQDLNTLIDLTTATAPVTVKQLRGRSIRIKEGDEKARRKVANNWDVVCIAPELEKGLNDYKRFVKKHSQFFGISDDGQIEKGVGHVHPSFSDMTPSEIFDHAEQLNEEMIERALSREEIYGLWKVGHAYRNRTVDCLEVSNLDTQSIIAPFLRHNLSQAEHASELRRNLFHIWAETLVFGGFLALTSYLALNGSNTGMAAAVTVLTASVILTLKRYSRLSVRYIGELCRTYSEPEHIRCMARAVISALKRAGLLTGPVSVDDLIISRRLNGSYRIFASCHDLESSRLFLEAMSDVLRPLTNPSHVVPKFSFVPACRIRKDSKDNRDNNNEKGSKKYETRLFKNFVRGYLSGRLEPTLIRYYAVPRALSRSARGRKVFLEAWQKYVSPAEMIESEKNPEIVGKYFGRGPTVLDRLIWE